jgi:uncharacterized protein (TIGR02266 family)
MDNPEERRSGPRVRIPITTRVIFREGNREEVWFTEDLGEGGLFLKTENPPYTGVQLDLEISLPGMTELVIARGEVVWRHEGRGCGVRFVRITALKRKILKEFLDGHA